MHKRRVVILGAGLTGLSAGLRLAERAQIFEKEDRPGGLCRTVHAKGYDFDIAGGHVLHLKNQRRISFFQSFAGGDLLMHRRKSFVRFAGRYISYPFQSHLQELPKRSREACVRDFQKVRRARPGKDVLDLKGWFLNNFGSGICRSFMFPYNRKLWKCSLSELMAEGIKDWITPASLARPVRRVSVSEGYNAKFWYPQQGGIEKFANGLSGKIRSLHLRHRAVSLDLCRKKIIFSNGRSVRYERLISSIPLPELGAIAKPLPESVRLAFKSLRHMSLLNVHMGLKKRVPFDAHWIYFPQKDFPFYRVNFSVNCAKRQDLSSKASVSFEISFLPGKKPDKKRIIDALIRQAVGLNFLSGPKDIELMRSFETPYAYCLFNEQRNRALALIRDFLAHFGIISCGRFGSWGYGSMEDAVDAGGQAALLVGRQRGFRGKE